MKNMEIYYIMEVCMDKRYMIKEAAARIEVEPHVLRYWEEEIGLTIKRNEMGHRYYDEEDIAMLLKIKELKNKGHILKTIRNDLMIKAEETQAVDTSAINISEEKMRQFQNIMTRIVGQAIKENASSTVNIGSSVSQEVSQIVVKHMEDFNKENIKRDEERFRRLDETIRQLQKARQEAATATSELEGKKRGRKNRFKK